MSKKFTLSRRTLLRGAGALLALPLLEQMLPHRARADAAATPAGAPRRLFVFYTACGIHMPRWTPSAVGSDWQLTPTLQPLAPVKDDLIVISGLANAPGRPDGDGHHAAATSAFLSCAKAYKTEGTDIHSGISMDQVAANAVGKATRFASLELGIDAGKGIGNCDSGYACPYANNIAWAGPATPVPKETRPQAVFNRLFADFDPSATQAQVEKRRAYGLSIIDFVREDAKSLQGQLGGTDRRKLDEYLTGVRELELRVNALESQGPSCSPGVAPEDTTDVRVKAKAMMDLVVLAFQCDLTRICTFMLANARSDKAYPFLGLTSGHHTYSHHQNLPSNFEALATIDRWEVEQYAYLVQRLKAVQESDATLLDHSMAYFSSEIADGNSHEHKNLPILIAGRAGGALHTNRHLRYSGDPLANLFISMLGILGAPVSQFGDGTGPLSGLEG
ncbi:transcriptional initiation protein Tat [Corallococcus sp. H22C18031201]|uniref:DUF1552 domain-containing protein n=1 Tax=Citreicoccus inhibens TaxID=2849499 RepID=UPI000E72C9C9|nr:DUF1552 domain-containing protein [Citreicoccus inhibens]MBU8896815.1 DUF1552 domain-containing protein [Citreicoccus inhibens]RJS21889.1 transcriptional initiation protein Tat [Corallococcus sp. H22C18031201]